MFKISKTLEIYISGPPRTRLCSFKSVFLVDSVHTDIYILVDPVHTDIYILVDPVHTDIYSLVGPVHTDIYSLTLCFIDKIY